MTAAQWTLYLGVVLLSTASPGPAVLLSVSNALTRGLRASALSSLGNICGLFCLSGAAFAGVGGVLKASPLAFGALKVAGAAYLVYLGVRRWTAAPVVAPDGAAAAPAPAHQASRGLVLQGAMVALTNPKALLFFGALFPQFIHTASPLLPQFLGLTGTLMLFSFGALMAYAVLARQAHRWVPGRSAPGRGLQRVVGGAFILLGLALLLTL